MKYVFYDVETTGLCKRDEVIEFAGVVTDEKLRILKVARFYCYTQVPIHKDAFKVHGLSASALMKLSDGKTFEDRFYELDFVRSGDVVWVAYSSNGFDKRLINQTLTHNGLPPFDFGTEINYLGEAREGIHEWDAFKHLSLRCFNGGKRKLSQIAAELPFGQEKLDLMFKQLVGEEWLCDYHDAIYDSFILWVIVSFYRTRLGFCEL